MSNIIFKENTVNISKNLSPGETYKVIFEFDGDPSVIAHVSPACGCTANCKVVENTIQADYTDQTSPKAAKGIYDFSKNINVFYNNGEEVWVSTGMGKSINPQLRKEVITFKGKVEVK